MRALDLVTVIVGLPVGVLWLYLRVEAFAGGRGDRFLPGTPAWLRAVPAASCAYVAGVVTAAVVITGSRFVLTPMGGVNAVLVAIWAITSPDALFWPIFPILGWGVGVAANAWDVFLRKPITDADVDREAQRMRGDRMAT